MDKVQGGRYEVFRFRTQDKLGINWRQKPEDEDMTQPIYLDYNATTPHDPEVIEAMREIFEREFGNPSSTHWYGIAPKRAVDKAR